jgi:hypothetical protein
MRRLLFSVALLVGYVACTSPAPAALVNAIPLSQKGAPNGVATTNGSSKLTAAQVPTILTANLGSEVITEAQLATGAVGSAKVGAEAIGSAALKTGAVTTSKIASEAVGSAQLASNLSFTGVPLGPTAAAKTNTTQLATTAFVMGAMVETEALAIPLTQKGVASGVPELTSGGVVPEAELPKSVPLAKEKALGEVEGTVTLNLEEGSTFTATLKKNVTFKITKAPSRPTEVSLVLTENSTGGWTWSVESLSWVGSEPTFPTTKSSKSFESVVVNKAGGEILGLAGQEGKEGKTGPTGPTGPEGAKGANGEGVPTGGTTGQYLKKKSNTNFDTEWAAGSGGGETELSYAAVESLGTNVEQQGGEYGEAKYAVGGTGRVYLAGALKIKAELVANKLVLTLPTSARPTVKKECWAPNLNSAKEGQSLTIKTNGEVLNNGTSAVTWVFDLDGCTFSKGA